MNFLAIDYGERRIGLAHGDSEIGIAMPVPAAVEPDFEGRLAHIAAEIKARRIGTLVVGYPVNMDGSVGFKAREVDAFIAQLEARFALPVVRTDERRDAHELRGGSRDVRQTQRRPRRAFPPETSRDG